MKPEQRKEKLREGRWQFPDDTLEYLDQTMPETGDLAFYTDISEICLSFSLS